MGKQLIISISREYGSGGHLIAEELADRFSLPLYDHNLLDELAKEKGYNVEKLNKYDESPRRKFFSRSVRGHSNSPEEAVANMQFDFLKDKAKSGESFVVVGRCSESILQEYDGLVPIFVMGDVTCKLKRVMAYRNCNEQEAREAMERHDKNRRNYHNHYCDIKWGDSRHYEICINSSKVGIDKTTDFLESYIKERIES